VIRRSALVLGVLVVAGCGSGGSTTVAAPTRDERCLNVPASLVHVISTKLKDGGTLTSAQAVKSFDYESPTYFVSAKLDSGDIGTWAVVGKLGPGGSVYAVDDVAKERSTWPAGDTSSTYVSMIDDGAEPSRSCAAAS
jgi:hypothetical protein